MESVDDIWLEMKKESHFKGKNIEKILHHHISASLKKSNSKNSKKTKLHKCSKQVLQLPISSTNEDSQVVVPTNVTSPLETSPGSAFDVLRDIQRDINFLNSENPIAVRKQAVLNIERKLFVQRIMDDTLKEEVFIEISKPIFKKFNDSVENVRERAVLMSINFTRSQKDLLQILPYMIPAIMNQVAVSWEYDEGLQIFVKDRSQLEAHKRGRIQQTSTISPQEYNSAIKKRSGEQSEEIRLLFTKLIGTILENAFERNVSSLLNAYIYDIIVFLVAGTQDSFHAVNILSCNLLELLATHMISVVKHFSVGLIRIIKNLLDHRHSSVRIACILAISKLVSCPNIEKCKGSGSEAILDLIGHRDENVIPVAAFYTSEIMVNQFAKLNQDPKESVRKCFYEVIGDWLSNLPDRYDYETRLLPYILSALSDKASVISKYALDKIEELGMEYEKEHPNEIIERRQYGVDGDASCNHLLPLPPPFKVRPSIGARLFVRGRCRRFINTLLREISNWQSPTRLNAAQLLKCIIVYSEEHVTVDLHILINELLKCYSDEGIHSTWIDIAILLGRFTAPSAYLNLILPYVRCDSDISAFSSQAVVALLYYFVYGTHRQEILVHLDAIIEEVHNRYFYNIDNLRTKNVRDTLLKLVQVSLKSLKGGKRSRDEASYSSMGRLSSDGKLYYQLFRIILILKSFPTLLDIAENDLLELAKIQELASTENLFHFHSSHLLDDLISAEYSIHSAIDWSLDSTQHILLTEILSSGNTFCEHMSELLDFAFDLFESTSTTPIHTKKLNNRTQRMALLFQQLISKKGISAAVTLSPATLRKLANRFPEYVKEHEISPAESITQIKKLLCDIADCKKEFR